MAKFKLPSVPKAGATDGAKPQPEPQKEEPKPKERKPIHPGLDVGNRCLRCGTFLAFHEPSLSEAVFTMPFGSVALAFCECGVWTRDQKGRIRWIRYSSGLVKPGEGEVFAP